MYKHTAHFYDFFGTDQSASRIRSKFISEFLRPQSRVIDIGAGTGEIALMLAAHGHSVHCIEPSDEMHSVLLQRVSSKVELASLITSHPSKLEDLRRPLRADLAYASSVVSHLNAESRKKLLFSLQSHLAEDGLLIFNCLLPGDRPNKTLTKIGEKKVGEITYRHFSSSQQIDSNQRKVVWRFEIDDPFAELKVFEEEFNLTLDKPTDIEKLLNEFGFRLKETFGSFERETFKYSNPGFVIVAEKVRKL